MKPFIIVGTRPEIVKMAPIIYECENRGIDYYFLHTGQHYSEFMSRSIFDDMELRTPDKNLNIGSGTQSEQMANALMGIEKELINESPDVVFVLGDTNAVLSAALATVKLQIPLAHIEAGLRSYDLRMPEEYNRRLTDHASDYLFAPTENSAEILRKENVLGKIYVTGNTVIDALENRLPIALRKADQALDIELDSFALLTLHRAENVDDKTVLQGLIEGLISLEMSILFPAHPRTVKRLTDFGLISRIKSSDGLRIIEPVSYLDFLILMKKCSFILTDSGGIQEEATAPSVNKKAFVLRTSTERPEAVASGHAVVVGVNPEEFPAAIKDGIQEGVDMDRLCPYGEGDASKKIMKILCEELE
ncbi:MAG: non-hydrolyzing UDP-N-acetylglucosamine 2-epimerase [Candidatus Thorarchaeota archaeon]